MACGPQPQYIIEYPIYRGAHLNWRLFQQNSNLTATSFSSHSNFNTWIVTKFCTWYNSCVVVVYVIICSDLLSRNGIIAKWIFHRIWIWIVEKIVTDMVPRPHSYQTESGWSIDQGSNRHFAILPPIVTNFVACRMNVPSNMRGVSVSVGVKITDRHGSVTGYATSRVSPWWITGLASSQWETLQSNAISHWLGSSLESALNYISPPCDPHRPAARRTMCHGSITLCHSRVISCSGKICKFAAAQCDIIAAHWASRWMP